MASKKKALLGGIEDEFIASTIESFIPKLKPMIKPALEKFKKYLGDNDRFICIRQMKESSVATVIIFNNKAKGRYMVVNNGDTGEKVFEADQVTVEGVYNIEDFVEKLLTGDFTRMLEKAEDE